MGCDGLWDVIENQDAIDFVLKKCYDIKGGRRILKGKDEKNNIAKKLADFAIKKGSSDNVSVIIVFFR